MVAFAGARDIINFINYSPKNENNFIKRRKEGRRQMQTQQLADYIADIHYENLSAHVIEVAKKTVLDIIGVAIAGSSTKDAEIWERYYSSDKTSGGQANAWRGDFPRMGYKQAAALNAACGHILDFDDVLNEAIAHLGVVTVPAALAVSQKLSASGKRLIEAVTAGFEIGARVGRAINPGSYRIWHTTGVVGALCSSAAVGKLLGLNGRLMQHAFGNAGTQASGLWEFMSDGAMSKPLHTANATACGIRASELAELGLTGASRILEGDQGMLRAFDTEYRPELLTYGLGGEYMIAENSFKLYPCCRHTHSGICSMDRLLKAHPVDAAHIAAIRVYTYTASKNLTDRPEPATPYACKFSIQYCLSAMVINGGYDPKIFDAEAIDDPAIRRLMKRITVCDDDAINEGIKKDSSCWANRTEIVFDNGAVFCESTAYPPGDSHIPMSWDDLLSKFHSMTDGVLGRKCAEQLVSRIQALEKIDDVNMIFV
ncbi:MAG: MmgE/PrpD family protein [Oscillospiraceae bacterium]|nr:MmgE/PrpD family protein [Oscillospiraceae bacterium]